MTIIITIVIVIIIITTMHSSMCTSPRSRSYKPLTMEV